jgi:hypothetical protein
MILHDTSHVYQLQNLRTLLQFSFHIVYMNVSHLMNYKKSYKYLFS